MVSTRAASKRVKKDGSELPTSFDLLTLYQSDIGDKILSYASGADLCTLDILSKQFNRLTANQWKAVTKDRFGMFNGKEDWKVGTSFLRPARFIHNIVGDYGIVNDACSHIAANESIVVDVQEGDEFIVRDASNLDTKEHVTSPISNWKVSVCGQIGLEIIVTSNARQICAQLANGAYSWLRDEDSSRRFRPGVGRAYAIRQQWEYDGANFCGIETIGCETHLVVAHDGKIQLYEAMPKVELERLPRESYVSRQEDYNATLLSLRKDIRVEEGVVDEYEVMDMKLAWAPDKKHFIVGYPHRICVWKLDAANNDISLVKTIDTEWEVTNVSLAEDYIIASSKTKEVHVWHRITGDKIVYGLRDGTTRDALCDIDNGHQSRYEEEEFVWPLSLSCHGRILVSTSHVGCAICVWDMKTGELLKRHDEANEQGVVEMLPDKMFSDVTDMVYLERLNAFICMGEYQNMWIFPTNQEQSDAATLIEDESGEPIDSESDY